MSPFFQAPLNTPGEVAANAGYRVENRYPSLFKVGAFDPHAPRDPFIALAFSGGGTRAAALSYGVLEQLRHKLDTPYGEKTRLLDCVELISSVSGGSFTAARYGLITDDIFAEGPMGFREQMLYAHLQLRLIATWLAPWNRVRLLSPYFDRVDLAAEVYQRFFGRATYADLKRNAAPTAQGKTSPPFIVLNATNMTLESRFEFTQYQLDMLGSTIDDYPIARAVAASSAFPFAFSPLTLKNYGAPRYNWLPFEEGIKDFDLNLPRYRESLVALQYKDNATHAFAHLLDGGLADNTGVRYIVSQIRNRTGTLRKLMLEGARDTFAIIVANATSAPSPKPDRRRYAPGLLGVLLATGSVAIDNYVDDSVEDVEQALNEFTRVQVQTYERLAHKPWKDPDPLSDRAIRFPVIVDNRWVRTVSAYVIHVTFEAETCPKQREDLFAVPTSFYIGETRARVVVESGRRLLVNNAEYQAFLAEIAHRAAAKPAPPVLLDSASP